MSSSSEPLELPRSGGPQYVEALHAGVAPLVIEKPPPVIEKESSTTIMADGTSNVGHHVPALDIAPWCEIKHVRRVEVEHAAMCDAPRLVFKDELVVVSAKLIERHGRPALHRAEAVPR
jgi:hypothetical protein